VPRYLADIVAAHRSAAAADERDPAVLKAEAMRSAAPPPFAAALTRTQGSAPGAGETGLAVIAEVKRRSPSKGDLAPDLDPAAVAAEYAAGGAVCLSVLTDQMFFGGGPEDVAAVRQAVALPVLRKDFTVSENDVCDARLMGASAVLLIVAALDDAELDRLHGLARQLGLDALVEVHDDQELDRALCLGAPFVGVNQRDLETFQVDGTRAERLAGRIPPGVVAVAESGVRSADDAARLAAAGYQAVLVGESVVTSGHRAAAVRALAGHPVGARSGRSPDATAGGLRQAAR
jgi:indole-3-glycerol phosphate synthase